MRAGALDVGTMRTPVAEALGRRLEAAAYDRWFDSPWGRYSFDIELGAVSEAVGPLSSEVRVLDAGCGTGRFTAQFEASGATVVGLDLDPAMLEVASGRTRGRLVLGDVGCIPAVTGPSTESSP